MKIALSGIIQSKKHLYYGKEACYGITRANKDKFKIYLSQAALKDGYTFSETLLHELLHLWFFVISSVAVRVPSEEEQHEVLQQVIPIILSRTSLILKRKGKGNEKGKKQKTN